MLLHASFYEYFLFLCVVEPIHCHPGLGDLYAEGDEDQEEKQEVDSMAQHSAYCLIPSPFASADGYRDVL